MSTTAKPLMILVAGPYRSGTDGDQARIRVNLEHMRRAALELYRRGHLPVLGEWFALPLIEEAELTDVERDGSVDVGDEVAHGRHQRYDP